MSKLVSQAEESLRRIIADTLDEAVRTGALPDAAPPAFTVEIPADRANGDYATNAALVGAKAYRMTPRTIADKLLPLLRLEGSDFEKAEAAGPGFINFTLAAGYYADIVTDILAQGGDYGRSDFGAGKRVVVEFVSANPTGPMHIGNARGGALGDALSSLLAFTGHDVCREFYINDAGNQIAKFGESLEARYLQIYKPETEFPEDGYHGGDIKAHAEAFAEQYGEHYLDAPEAERRQALVDYALPRNIQTLEDDLARYGIHYDVWSRESAQREEGGADRVVELLTERGFTYKQDGAMWFKATEFGEDKDYVLVRSNGQYTYVVPDIAYHYNKLVTRGFALAVDVLGADHHGYAPRLKHALTALGVDESRLDVVIMQMVRLVRGGEVIKASKRTGKSITLATLLDEVPLDAARFFFNSVAPNTHFNFDLDLAVEKGNENPVYYVQYAHARICSILRALAAEGVTPRACARTELCALIAPEERDLIRHLASLTGEVAAAAKNYDPSRVAKFALELAARFHRFYTACRVKGEAEPLMQARLALCLAARQALENALGLLGVSAPESM